MSTTGGQYEFEACEKEDYVYQLDYKEAGSEDEDYIQLFQDYGWEYVTKYKCWYYFRKRKEGDEDLSIFSDNESKIQMCARIVNGRFLRILPLYAVLLVFNYLTFFTDLFRGGGFWRGLAMGIAMGAMLITFFGFGAYINQVQHLQNKMKKLQ